MITGGVPNTGDLREMKEDEKEEGDEVGAMVYVDLPPTRGRA